MLDIIEIILNIAAIVSNAILIAVVVKSIKNN